jgi:5'-nucleotidase
MRILLTNDDGIRALGINSLCKCLSEIGEVSVVAPDSERSATGHGITLRKPLMIKEIDMGFGGITGYSVSGTPADCVKLALQGQLVPLPDIVISGINQGQNLGTDVLYSGTVSAAIEGALLGVPAIAVSLTSYKYQNFDFAAAYTKKLCLDLINKKLTKDTLLNVDVPPLNPDEVKGVRITKLGETKYTNVFEGRVDPRGQKYFWQGGEILIEECCDTETDVYAVSNNYISVTPIHFDLTNFAVMDQVKGWHLEK